jgi:hypothetical protein
MIEVANEIRTEDVPHTSVKRYCYTKLLDNDTDYDDDVLFKLF